MKTTNTKTLSRKISTDSYDKLNKLSVLYGNSLNKALEHIIDRQYDMEFNNPDTVPIKQRQECLTIMCRIVNDANGIEDDLIRESILEEVKQTCHILNR